jgi:hypothetical protein
LEGVIAFVTVFATQRTSRHLQHVLAQILTFDANLPKTFACLLTRFRLPRIAWLIWIGGETPGSVVSTLFWYSTSRFNAIKALGPAQQSASGGRAVWCRGGPYRRLYDFSRQFCGSRVTLKPAVMDPPDTGSRYFEQVLQLRIEAPGPEAIL